jgi:ABC-type branched-subunit amino acid transport system substrate-binding protein
MTIFSLTGKLATTGNAVSDAAAAAVKSVNATCAAGRPIDVTVCDDQSTPNGSLQCGEKARSNRTLALIGFTAGAGGSDQGAQTANLPAVFTSESSSWDGTSKLSYPNVNNRASNYGQVLLAKALGKTSFTLAAVDVPPAHLAAQVAENTASSAGITFNQTYFPLTTTDYSSVAAQIVSSRTGALEFLVAQPEQFLTALSAAGLDPGTTSLINVQGILTPTQKQTLAKTVEGSYEVGGVIPASVTSNPGIKQMQADYRAAGKTFSALLPAYAVQEWSSIQALAVALKPLSKPALGSLTSDSLRQAVISHGEYNLPTVAPFNFQKQPFPASSILGQGRTFSEYQQVFQIKNGQTVPVGGFQSLLNGTFSAKG